MQVEALIAATHGSPLLFLTRHPSLTVGAIESGITHVNLAGATDCSQSVLPLVSTRFDKQTVAPRHHIILPDSIAKPLANARGSVAVAVGRLPRRSLRRSRAVGRLPRRSLAQADEDGFPSLCRSLPVGPQPRREAGVRRALPGRATAPLAGVRLRPWPAAVAGCVETTRHFLRTPFHGRHELNHLDITAVPHDTRSNVQGQRPTARERAGCSENRSVSPFPNPHLSSASSAPLR